MYTCVNVDIGTFNQHLNIDWGMVVVVEEVIVVVVVYVDNSKTCTLIYEKENQSDH
jgi:hypothetical protein